MSVEKENKSYINCSIVVHKEGDQFVSWCPELDVASSGDNVELACDNLKDAINCFLETYFEIGELDQMLSEKGIVLNSGDRCSPVYLTEARIGVPTIA
jgi:predicted RNase H-like HicB family nuclease